MIINYVPGEECRIAIVQDGKLEEFYQERASTQSHVGNIYKGRVTNVEPAIQAAFVDFGLGRNGFLHITDVHPKYFSGSDREEFEKVGKKTARHERPPIQKCLKRGQDILVQVLKEGIGTKGPTVTSYLSIPGRFLVMMPDMQRLGVSRKVEDDDARKKMRDILKALEPPKDFGFIVRTAGMGQTKTDLKRDLSYLARLWKSIETKRKAKGRFGELYAESDLVIRTIRDIFSGDIDRIVCDDITVARRARDFLAVANPRAKSKVVYYDDATPVFNRMGIESQIANISAREVPLPSGGALVIDSTEALVAIDVNSGRSRAARDAETNAYKTNLEAVDEIARQLRLRDLGGLVVLDLIDMRPMKNRKTVENQFRNNLKRDRARTRIGAISQFGLLEMTRQRMRPSLKSSIYNDCVHCTGRGYAMSPESVILSVMRQLALAMQRDNVTRIELTISPDVAFHMLNRKRGELVALEKEHGTAVTVRVGGGTVDHIGLAAFNDAGGSIPVETTARKLSEAQRQVAFRELDDSDLPEEEAEADLDTTFYTDSGDDSSEESSDEQRETSSAEQADEGDEGRKPRRRRRRGRGRGGASDRDESENRAEKEISGDDSGDEAKADHKTSSDSNSENNNADEDNDGRRRRRRRGRGRGRSSNTSDTQDVQEDAQEDATENHEASDSQDDVHAGDSSEDDTTRQESGRRRRTKRRRGRVSEKDAEQVNQDDAPEDEVSKEDASENAVIKSGDSGDDTSEDRPRSRRRSRRRRRGSSEESNTQEQSRDSTDAPTDAPTDVPVDAPEADSIESQQSDSTTSEPTEASSDDDGSPRRRRRRRSRGGSGKKDTEGNSSGNSDPSAETESGADAKPDDEPQGGRTPRKRAPAKKKTSRTKKTSTRSSDASDQDQKEPEKASKPRRRRSRKPSSGSGGGGEPNGNRNTVPPVSSGNDEVDGNVADGTPAKRTRKPRRKKTEDPGDSNDSVYSNQVV